MVHFWQTVLYKFLHGGTRRIHGDSRRKRLLLLQNLRDSSVPSVFILKICKEPFILIEPCRDLFNPQSPIPNLPFYNAFNARSTLSFGLTFTWMSASLPASSMRKWLRMMPS
jgi:hypothetical protein